MTTIAECFAMIEAAKEAANAARIQESEAYKALAEVAGAPTFAHEGLVYQVRHRHNKEMDQRLYYITNLKVSEDEFLAVNKKLVSTSRKNHSSAVLQAVAQRLGCVLSDEEARAVAETPDDEPGEVTLV